MTRLVTGTTGFVGAHVVSNLIDSGHSVRVLVRDIDRARNKLGGLIDRVEVHQGDLTDPASLAGVCDGVECVIHTAIANMHTFAAGRGDDEAFV